MRVVIAGGHGKIAMRLARLLAAHGDQAVGIIRDPAQAADLRAVSAEPVVLDLETAETGEVAEVLRGADAAVFAAGAGPGSGVARKDTVDRGAAALFAAAAERAAVRRLLQIGSIGVGRPPRPGTDEVFAAYLRAKEAAEQDLRARDLDWTILRPGRLTDEPGTGEVHLADSVGYGEIPRDDVAAVLLALLEEQRSVHRTLELVGGNTPIDEAVARI
ncbi:NAD-dependent epimerase/dehydratase family protein [Amycolatopsis rhizosphaerae]|uniref:NAD-dependent epimerase/dehydratase family protein n=1 Tax=Amycolatopsis rhizosphaerae TaxID=2053003 RepID=A0A558B6V9_9PSEU|nr:NAD(P)H-binding protein [Amycolatopsis rhizosphaerae]TVT32254.1 NAD-dependent epimerase/dehydratase family protein [Amycolatopsis rhizosphaerae]